jgi:hypothetical protein
VRRRAAGLGQTWSGPSRCRGGQRQQSTWLEWVVVGSPPQNLPTGSGRIVLTSFTSPPSSQRDGPGCSRHLEFPSPAEVGDVSVPHVIAAGPQRSFCRTAFITVIMV